jgi:hypothetical protein
MSRIMAVFVVVLAMVAWTGCGGGESSPSGPTYQASTPTPYPSPMPSPSPTPIDVSSPDRGTCPASCWEDDEPKFEQVLVDAEWEILNEHPEWFDRVSMAPDTKVLKLVEFWDALLDKINENPPYEASHHCRDYYGVISIKNSNRFSENFKVITSAMAVKAKYADTCWPSWF